MKATQYQGLAFYRNSIKARQQTLKPDSDIFTHLRISNKQNNASTLWSFTPMGKLLQCVTQVIRQCTEDGRWHMSVLSKPPWFVWPRPQQCLSEPDKPTSRKDTGSPPGSPPGRMTPKPWQHRVLTFFLVSDFGPAKKRNLTYFDFIWLYLTLFDFLERRNLNKA